MRVVDDSSIEHRMLITNTRDAHMDRKLLAYLNQIDPIKSVIRNANKAVPFTGFRCVNFY